MIGIYDVKRRAETKDEDGIPLISWSVLETRKLEFQPIQWSQREAANRIEIDLGGIKYVPTFYGWTSDETLITASDWITKDSGTHNYLVLRAYTYEDHKEFDLIETESS